jgi:hypothetical protein
MTRYEKALEEGLQPMDGLEWALLEMYCENLINNTITTMQDIPVLKELWMEIEHLYKDQPEKLNLIYEKIYL